MKSFIGMLVTVLMLSIAASAQTGAIKGTVTDKKNNEPIPFVGILVLQDNKQIASGQTDFDGNFTIKPINAGKYDVRAVILGYEKVEIKGVMVQADKIAFTNIKMASTTTELKEFVKMEYKVPLIEMDFTSTGATMTRDEIASAPSRSISSVSNSSSGVTYNAVPLNIRGGRSNTFQYYTNGAKVKRAEAINESYSRVNENDFLEALKTPLSTFSIDVDKASYSNVRRFINDGQMPPQDAVRIEELINYFAYDYSKPSAGKPFSVNTELAVCPWNTNHKLIKIGLQSQVVETADLPANNLVFLIDVSGSMDEPNKLPLVKKGLSMLVNQMRDIDRISIVVYAGSAGVVLPSTSGSQKEKILVALDNLSAGGSTAGGEGIVLAYNIAKEHFLPKGNNRVILATDGDFNVGVSNEDDLEKLIESKRDDGVFLTVLGFGTGNYQDSKMERLADKGNGNYAYVDNLLEAQKTLVKEMGATLLTIAKDVKLQLEFNPAKVKAYRLVGYENRLLADKDFNDDTKDAGEMGAGHSVTALYEIIPAGSKWDVPTTTVDSLKYQLKNVVASNELLTVKLRYKDPKENSSKMIEEVMTDSETPFSKASDDFRFAASVAEWGMLLRDSKYKAGSDYKQVIENARMAKGKDNDGYRAEFVRLAELSREVSKQNSGIAEGK